VLGLGVGYPEQAAAVGREFGTPLATMRGYVDRMSEPTFPPAPDVAYPRIIAANGPKMVALAGDISDGVLPAGLPPEFTAEVRGILGPDKLLVVGLSVDTDRATARQRASTVHGRYATALARLGYSTQEIADVSDRLIDALIAHGDPAAVAATVREHRTAGADHVTLLLPIGIDYAAGLARLEELAPALADLA
jgi:probable F420-dependent oxidoreductase